MRYRGVVQRGKKRGTELGFPTINIPLTGESISGIFAATISFAGEKYPAAVYADISRHIIEAHVLDFNDDLYGKEVEVELFEKIRDDEKFDDEAELKQAIAEDVAKVREYFKQ
jgi:riboflavin kinase/FMN adenylyltransferase